MSVTVIYEFHAADGKASELLELLQQGRDFALTVEGCEGYDVYQGAGDPHRLVMLETWSSVEAHQEHFQKNVQSTGVLNHAVALMKSPPDISDRYCLRQ